MSDGKLWTQRDRFGNEIYLTRERWAHIINPDSTVREKFVTTAYLQCFEE